MQISDLSQNGPRQVLRLFAGFLAIMVSAVGLRAQVAETWENATTYLGPGQTISATNIVNDSGASIDIYFPRLTGNDLIGDLFYGWSNVQNFTNNGFMSCNTGFRFGTKSNFGSTPALNFDNAGIINCGADSNGIFVIQYTDSGITVGGYGGILIEASNVVNSGTIDTGTASLMRILGGNVDLTDGTMTMATDFSNFSLVTGSLGGFFFNTPIGFQTFTFIDLNLSAVSAGYGGSTNQWDPATGLNSTNDIFTSPPYQIVLNTAIPYINIVSNYGGSSNTLIQAVMLQDDRVGSSPTVYFYPGVPTVSGDSSVAIQWGGGFVDPDSGSLTSNYLALVNDYTLGSSTNILIPTNLFTYYFNLVPANYGFASSTQPILPFLPFQTPTASGIPTGFAFAPDGLVTNTYSFVNALLLPSTTPTNLIPGGSMTNIAGRVEINASQTLNISGVNIAGMNFLSLKGTNQFNNDGLARISSPYSDLYLGMTNGNLVLTNVLVSQLPQWNGTIQAWSGSWSLGSTNGSTNIYQVLVVDAAVSPVTLAQQQDVYLYSSNNLVISDDLYVVRNFYTSATNLVLTTNAVGGGALSFEGELNEIQQSFSWPAATPNLRVLTNNGVLNLANAGIFGSSALPYLSFVNGGSIATAANAVVVTGDFQNWGEINSAGSFNLQAETATLTNGAISAVASMTLSADSMVISNQNLSIGQGLTLAGTTLLTDSGATNGNMWSIGTNYTGFGAVAGLSLLSKPLIGDLLGTTIYESSPGSTLGNTWAGVDYGLSTSGFTNNEAVGKLILDSTTNISHFGKYTFIGAGVSNAIYIDYLEFVDAATNGVNNGYEFTPWVKINTNIVVYYAQAVAMGSSIAEKLDKASRAGANGGRLRWIPSYSGYFSGTNIVYPNGTTNFLNAALVQSTLIDSDGNGIVNGNDPTPFYVASEVDLNVQVTNSPSLTTLISWHSIPASTNIVYYTTDIGSTNWTVLTNFVSPAVVPPVGGWPITNLVADPVNLVQPHYYKVGVTPNNQLLYGH